MSTTDITTPKRKGRSLPAAEQTDLSASQAFAALGLGENAVRAITDLGYGSPTPIQEQAIPRMLAWHDIIAQAPAGTGKTAAFGLPIVEHLDEKSPKTQVLIVVPTRELAIQVSEVMQALGKYRKLITIPIYGGQPYERQLRALARGVQVVVGTPGRLLDHLNRKTLTLEHVKTVILDEADEMFAMGFIDDIETILAELPKDRQTALFSATIPPSIAKLAERHLREPERVSVVTQVTPVPQTVQTFYEVPALAKMSALSRILDLEDPASAIIFVRTRNDADEVAERLIGLGHLAEAIHGEINQSQRERALARFRQGRTRLLVATDVAARGLDIPDVSHIFNYDLPIEAESYIHRIGRTGRAGRSGKAMTLVTPHERRKLQLIEQKTRQRIQLLRLPTQEDVAAHRRAALRAELTAILGAGELDPFLKLIAELGGTHEPAEIAAAALKLAMKARETSRPGSGEIWLGSLTREPEPPKEIADLEKVEGGREKHRSTSRQVSKIRITLQVGRQHGVRPANLVAAIAKEANISGESIGDIDMYETCSFVELPEQFVDMVLAALNATTIRGKAPKAARAQPDDEQHAYDRERRDGRRNDRFEHSSIHHPPAPHRPGADSRKGYGSRSGRRDRPQISRERDRT